MGNNDERWKDPAAWSCLDDSQREIINEWYRKVSQSDMEDCEKKLKISRTAADTIIVPLSVWYAISRPDFGGGVLQFVLSFVAALFFFYFLSMVSYHVGDFACRDGFSKSRIIGYRIVYGAVTALLLVQIYV